MLVVPNGRVWVTSCWEKLLKLFRPFTSTLNTAHQAWNPCYPKLCTLQIVLIYSIVVKGEKFTCVLVFLAQAKGLEKHCGSYSSPRIHRIHRWPPGGSAVWLLRVLRLGLRRQRASLQPDLGTLDHGSLMDEPAEEYLAGCDDFGRKYENVLPVCHISAWPACCCWVLPAICSPPPDREAPLPAPPLSPPPRGTKGLDSHGVLAVIFQQLGDIFVSSSFFLWCVYLNDFHSLHWFSFDLAGGAKGCPLGGWRIRAAPKVCTLGGEKAGGRRQRGGRRRDARAASARRAPPANQRAPGSCSDRAGAGLEVRGAGSGLSEDRAAVPRALGKSPLCFSRIKFLSTS